MSLIDLASMVLAPTAVKDGKVYNAIPNDQDFTFSRGTEATRINSAGLIEKARTNFLLQSNTFDTTWQKYLTTLTSGQTGYDGSSNAWLLDKSASGFANIYQSVSTSGVLTASVYAKAGTNSTMILRCIGGTDAQGFFDLSNGTIEAPSANCIDAQINAVGNGWYRCSITFNTSSTTSVNIYPEYPFAGTTSGNILIQDAQLEQGLVATDVITTTTSSVTVGITDDLPRVDYSGGGCPSLLLEPSRTQLLTQSEYYSGSTWIKQSGTTVTQNTTDTLSPEGKYNASKVTSNGSNGLFHTVAYSGGGANTKSIYLKGVSGGEVVYLKDPYQTVSTKSCTLTTEWQRFTLSETQTSSTSLWIDDIPSGGIYMWGAMLELGSYVSSYIPSYGASVTRSHDVCKIIGANATDLVDIPKMTFFAEHYHDADNNNANVLAIARNTSGGTYGDFYSFIMRSDGQYMIEVRSSNTSQAVVRSATMTTGNHKIAAIIEENNIKLFVDGVLQNTDTNATLPTGLNEFYLGGYIDTTANYGTKKSFVIFPSALTDDQCIALTK